MSLVVSAAGFLARLYHYRAIIWAMAKRDLAARYVGTVGGALWAVLHPTLMILIYWFVFTVGFKVQQTANMPFVLYFVSGLVPWLLFNEVLSSSMTAVSANAALVKKTVFPSEILPLVHVVSASFTHLILLSSLAILYGVYGYRPRFSAFAVVVYYYAALGCLLLGLSWLVGALQVFHRDLAQAVGALLNMWFWLTPIVWSSEMIPPEYARLLQFNPMAYIVDGYRSALTDRPLWAREWAAVYFWAVSGPLLFLGAYVFKRLKHEFPELL